MNFNCKSFKIYIKFDEKRKQFESFYIMTPNKPYIIFDKVIGLLGAQNLLYLLLLVTKEPNWLTDICFCQIYSYVKGEGHVLDKFVLQVIDITSLDQRFLHQIVIEIDYSF